MSYVPSELSFLGIAKEVTPGTAVAATSYLRPTPGSMAPKPVVVSLYDEGVRASMAKLHGFTPGVTHAEYGWDSNLYADEFGWALASMLNDLTVTGASDPFTTTFSTLNSGSGQPTTYTLTDFNGNNTRQYAFSVFSELALKFSSEGLATYSAKLIAATSATGTKPTFSVPATTAMPSWQVATTIGGASSLVTDAEINVKRSVTPVFTLQNTSAPNSIFAAGDLEVSGSMTAVYDTAAGETIYLDYLNGTAVPVIFDLAQNVNREIKCAMSGCQLDDVSITRGAGKYAELAIKFTAIANATDAGASGGDSPCKFTTKSPSASGTYK